MKTLSVLCTLVGSLATTSNSWPMPFKSFAYGSAQEASPVCQLPIAQKLLKSILPTNEDRAEKILINCVRLSPRNADALVELALLIQHQVLAEVRPLADLQKSMALLSQAIDLQPNNTKVLYSMSQILAMAGQTDSAKQLFEDIQGHFPYDPYTLREKAKLQLEHNPQQALVLIEQAVQLGLPHTEAHDILVGALESIHQGSSSLSYTAALASRAQQWHEPFLYYKLGLSYAEQKNYKKAAQSFDQVLALEDMKEARLQLAVLQYQNLNKPRQALEHLKLLTNQLDEDTPSLTKALLYAHYSLALYAAKDHNGAAAAAAQAVRNSYENPDCIRAIVAEYRSRKALFILNQALELLAVQDPTFTLDIMTT